MPLALEPAEAIRECAGAVLEGPPAAAKQRAVRTYAHTTHLHTPSGGAKIQMNTTI